MKQALVAASIYPPQIQPREVVGIAYCPKTRPAPESQQQNGLKPWLTESVCEAPGWRTQGKGTIAITRQKSPDILTSPYVYWNCSRCAVVVVQQSAESLSSLDHSTAICRADLGAGANSWSACGYRNKRRWPSYYFRRRATPHILAGTTVQRTVLGSAPENVRFSTFTSSALRQAKNLSSTFRPFSFTNGPAFVFPASMCNICGLVSV